MEKSNFFAPIAMRILPSIIALAIAVGVTSFLIYVSGFDPMEVYRTLFYGAFGNLGTVARTLNKTTPLLFCSLGIILAFRCGVWNIGAEGQLCMGALGCTMAGLFVEGIPTAVHLLLVLVASFAGGGIWAGIAGFLKVKYKANEIITTLLMNFIAFWLIFYAVRFPLRPPTAFNPVTAEIAPSARLPIILSGTSLHAGILIALGLSIATWFLLQKTVLGYRIKAIGANPDAAFFGGISIGKTVMVSMILSGGLAGLAGMSEVSGIHYLLAENISFNYGYLAIVAALMGRLNPLGAILTSLFFGALLTGGRFIQASLGVPVPIVYVMMAVFMLSLLLEPALESRLLRHLEMKQIQKKGRSLWIYKR